MAGFTSYDDMIQEATVNGKIYKWDFFKAGGTAPAAGIWYSLARLNGYPAAISDGAAGSATPAAGGTALTNAGGTIFLGNQSPDLKTITHFEASAGTAMAQLILYDRLVHVSGIANNSTGNKDVGSATLPRYTDGKGVQVWLEYTTAGTTTATVVNLASYTDDAGNPGQTGGNFTAPATAMVLNSMIGPLPLATGDLGVQAVQTLNVTTASTNGVVQLILMRPLASLYVPANQLAEKDTVLQFTSLPQMVDGASLCLMYRTTATTAINLYGSITIVWG